IKRTNVACSPVGRETPIDQVDASALREDVFGTPAARALEHRLLSGCAACAAPTRCRRNACRAPGSLWPVQFASKLERAALNELSAPSVERSARLIAASSGSRGTKLGPRVPVAPSPAPPTGLAALEPAKETSRCTWKAL